MRRLKLERSNTFAFRKSLRREKAEKKQQTKRKNALHENPRHDSRSGSFDEEKESSASSSGSGPPNARKINIKVHSKF